MSKIDFSLLWKGIIVFSLSLLGSVVMKELEIFKSSSLTIPVMIFIVLLLLSTAIVNILWLRVLALISWRKTPRIRNLRLGKRLLKNGDVKFELTNKEFRKPMIWISKLQIADNPLSWFPISGAGFPIKSGESRGIFTARWDKTHRYFRIADFQDHDYGKVFGVGEYEFDIAITYGFTEKGNDLIKRFKTKLSFDENGIIKILMMKHAD
jgi:hypothetical protein